MLLSQRRREWGRDYGKGGLGGMILMGDVINKKKRKEKEITETTVLSSSRRRHSVTVSRFAKDKIMTAGKVQGKF